MEKYSHYRILADLFDFPDQDYPEKVEKVRAFLLESYPEAGKELDPFLDRLPREKNAMQELYTRSFDVQSITTLDVGYVVFGDDYKRGELLANLNREHKQVGNDCGTELADHLPNLLRLLPQLEDMELMEELVRDIIAPAVRSMIGEFEPKSIEKKKVFYKTKFKTLIESSENHATIYCHAIKAFYMVLGEDFSVEEKPSSVKAIGFLRSVGKELEIEKQHM